MGLYHLGKDKAKNLTGLFVYQDKRYGAVYYDVLTKAGYVIKDKDMDMYRFIHISLPTAPIVGFVSYYYLHFPIWAAIVAGLGFYIICHALFLNFWLYKKPKVANYKRPFREDVFTEMARKISKGSLIVLLLLATLLAVSCIIYAVYVKNNAINYQASFTVVLVLFALLGAFMDAMAIIVLVKQSKLDLEEEEK